MNRKKRKIVGVALTLALSASVIVGGALMISAASAKSIKTAPAVKKKSEVSSPTESKKTIAVLVKSGNGTVLEQVPVDSDLGKKLAAAGATAGIDTVISPESLKSLKLDSDTPPPAPEFVEGVPGKDDLTKEAAISAAKKAVQSKYAVTDKTMARFTAYPQFNVADPAKPQWAVAFDPTNSSDFSEIGGYYVILNARTGAVIKIMSAADGVG